MEQIKPQRRTNIFDYWNVNKKKKVLEESESLSKKCITHFEDIPNELFYELFHFLDAYHVYKAFYGLNIRLQSLLTNSTLPLKINISSMSKSNFQRYYRQIIMPSKHRITSLCLSNPFVVDIIFSPVRIASNFIRLETLIFDNIKAKYLANILHHLVSLSNLSSLVIIPIDQVSNSNDLYDHIFQLPALKYCKVSLKGRLEPNPLPMATNVTSPIENLVINNSIHLNHLNALLSYVPQVRRLTFQYLDGIHSRQIETFSVVLSKLTHVSLDIKNINFDQFESMIRTLFNQVQVLHISTSSDREYLNANRWEQLILSSMPQLRIFDFQYINFLEDEIGNNQMIYDSVINQFSSSFWYERKWYFGYQFYLAGYRTQVLFYSRNPYRRKQYTLYGQLVKNTRPHFQRRKMDFVDHVHIRGEQAMTSCINYFRDATKLTLSHSFGESCVWLGVTLNRIIPLKQLTTLIIDCDDFCFEQLIKLLRLTSNIHTLTFNCQSIKETNSTLTQQSEMFQLVSNTNTITNVTLKEKYSLENIKLLLALCPQMQHLTIDMYAQQLETTVQFILSKRDTTLQQLCTLCAKNTSKSMVGILKTLIESEELLANYLVKLIGTDLYFWW